MFPSLSRYKPLLVPFLLISGVVAIVIIIVLTLNHQDIHLRYLHDLDALMK
jgi:hypothetical protein